MGRIKNSEESSDAVIHEETAPVTKKRRNPFNTQQLKEEKERRQKKRARLIVRNISYKATEETLREHFGKFGEIEDLNLLKRRDGKLVGCAFVQYASVTQATKAILKANNQPYIGRPVYVDWAIGKDEYVAQKNSGNKEPQEKKPKVEVKDEEDESDGSNDSEEDAETSRNLAIGSEGEDQESIKSEEDEDDDDEDDDGNAEDSAAEPVDGDSDEDDKKDNKFKDDIDKVKKQKHISNDVQDGCTVFIKNVPFEAEDNDLRKVCRKYGPLYYAIINREKVSGHSKGTAFIKFKTKESADLCLQAGTDFVLLEQVLDPHPALSREEISKQTSDASKKNDSKDSRNLYLAREGLIMTGSKAAEGVSAPDMSKRHKLEQIKTQVLKNLNRFVSRNRLSIHNLPYNYDNDNLKQMVITYTGFKPHECRVMREHKITPEHPKGKSKGFGFMSFNTHQEALTALRKLNNNPKIFGNINRPIVAFSIEDRAVQKIKEKRVEKSKINNPTYQAKLEKRKEQRKEKSTQQGMQKLPKGTQQSDDKDKLKKHIKKLEKSRAEAKSNENNENKTSEEFEDFVGMAGKPGTTIRMRSNKKINEQAKEHTKRVKTDKRKEKQRKIKQMHLDERKSVDRPKQVRKVERDDMSSLVNKYKRMIDTSANGNDVAKKQKKSKRTKWYTE